MVGLGNSCRGMKSPPLLVAVLMACIIVLAFNYWVASSRSMDLQGRVMDLEGKVRRAAVERGAVEQKKNEFQGELEKQRQQIDKIQSLHSFQMENANRVHQEEKIYCVGEDETRKPYKYDCLAKDFENIETISEIEMKATFEIPQLLNNGKTMARPAEGDPLLMKQDPLLAGRSKGPADLASLAEGVQRAVLMSNITVNDRLIQSLREHLKELQTEYGKLQLDVYWFQKNQTNLQRKFSYDLSQCINQMKELKEQCEERIDELRKKNIDAPQIKENKDVAEDSRASTQLPALKQAGFKQADLEQQKTNEDVPKAVPTVRKTDLMQVKERTDSLTDMRKHKPKAEEEQLSSQLEKPQESFKAAAGHKEMLPVSEKEPNPPEDEKHVAGQDMPEPVAKQAASEEVEREQFLSYDDKQDDLLPGKADKQEHEEVNQDKDIDYNLDVNEAESETDKQAALAGIENVQNHEDMKNHLPDNGQGLQKL